MMHSLNEPKTDLALPRSGQPGPDTRRRYGPTGIAVSWFQVAPET